MTLHLILVLFLGTYFWRVLFLERILERLKRTAFKGKLFTPRQPEITR